MYPSSAQDLFYLVGAVCVLWITGFLCWSLYEAARLIHQANQVVKDGREKLSRFERAVAAMAEKIANVSQYLGFIAEGGKQIVSHLRTRDTHRKNDDSKYK